MAASTPPFRAGSVVELRGLKARPELNGVTGTVLGPEHSQEALDAYARGRTPVLLDKKAGGGTMLLKPESLVLVASGDGYEELCESGWAHFERRAVEPAVEAYRRAIALEPASFLAHFQLGQVYEGNRDDLPGATELAAQHYLAAMEAAAPESPSPDFGSWSNAFVRGANLLAASPSAAKPAWWTPVGLKRHVGLVLANPQGLLPDSHLVTPAWQLTAHAFEMENNLEEAAKCYQTAAGYEMDKGRCEALLARAAELGGGQAV